MVGRLIINWTHLQELGEAPFNFCSVRIVDGETVDNRRCTTSTGQQKK